MAKILLHKMHWQEFKYLYCLGLFKFFLHLVTGWQYGYFRDELYYLSMSDHLDYGYVDVAPIVPLLMKISRFLFGSSIQSIHIFPALAGAMTLVCAGLIAHKLGAGKFAVTLTGIVVLSAPLFQSMSGMFTYDCFDQLMSALFIYVIICILQSEEKPNLWMIIGVVAGIGLMVKISFMFLGFSFVIALLFTKKRCYFTSRWLWIGGVIAFVIVSPYIVWQIQHGSLIFAYWEQYANGKTVHASIIEYILMEILVLNPLCFPLWMAGLYFLLWCKKGNDFRVLGIMHIVYLVLSILMSFKFYLMAGTFFAVIAGGTIIVEELFRHGNRKTIKYLYASAIFMLGLVLLPLSVPVLPIKEFMKLNAIAEHFGSNTVQTETHEMAELPQQFADRFGWEALVKTISHVYVELPPEEREKCAIFAGNYGEAGAIDFYGSAYNLPKSISGHLSHYVWGPRDYTGELVIVVGWDYEALKDLFEVVEIKAVTDMLYAMPYENHRPIYLCRNSKVPLKEMWQNFMNLR